MNITDTQDDITGGALEQCSMGLGGSSFPSYPDTSSTHAFEGRGKGTERVGMGGGAQDSNDRQDWH